jgi:hypothetical protein
MAKRKIKEVKKKTGTETQKYMIYIVSAIMLFSGLIWMTERVEQGGPNSSILENTSNVVKYNVVPVGNGSSVVRVGTATNEIAAIPKRPEFVRAEGLTSVLNESFDGVDRLSVELSNAYILFRFQAYNASSAFASVSSELKSYVGDVRVYRVYDGLISGGSISLLADYDLNEGDFVRAIILERQDNFKAVAIQTEKVFSESGNATGV